MIGEGPSLGDINHWNYETFDIASYLKIGENVLEAVVWNNGSYMAVNQFTVQTAFLLQGNTKKSLILIQTILGKYEKLKDVNRLTPI